MVREFTQAASKDPLPDTTDPRAMTLDEIDFVVKMVTDELLELYATVTDSSTAKDRMHSIIREAKELAPLPADSSDTRLIADQTDAFVDAVYYIYDACAKKGLPVHEVFEEVHRANMAKAGPDGKFHRRPDGKVIKPSGWVAPDVERVIRQLQAARAERGHE